MGEHARSHATLVSHTPRQEAGTAHSTSRYTLMMLSELVASIGHVEPLFVGGDGFPELAQDPLHMTQHAISAYLAEMTNEEGPVEFADSTHAHALLHAKPRERGDTVCALLTRLQWVATQTHFLREVRSGVLVALLERLLGRSVSYHQDMLVESLYHVGAMEHLCSHEFPWGTFLRSIEEHLGATTLGAGEIQGLAAMRMGELLKRRTLLDRDRHMLRLEKMISGCQEMHVELGAVWSDAMHHELEAMEDSRRAEWDALLTHIVNVSIRPSKRWLKRTRGLMEGVGESHVRGALLRWLPSFGRRASLDFTHCSKHDPMSSVPSERNEDMLRGLAFLSSMLGGETLSAVIGDMTLASYHKVPGHGPRSVRVGNACIWALGHMPQMACLGQLWRVRQKLSYATADRQIEHMIQAAAERFMISMEDLEELAVPTFGMDSRGCVEEEVGDWRFELELTASRKLHTRWVRQSVNGQAQLFALLQDEEVSHTLPRSLARTQPTQSARLEALPREIEKMVQAQGERLELMYWSGRTWGGELWAERYLEHPLLRVLCEDLIWHMSWSGGESMDVMPHRGECVTSQGERVDMASLTGATVSLWHPVRASEADVMSWRTFLHDRRITQPFKQAHREVFDVAQEQEGGAGVLGLPGYVLKQHQFIALCKARGWQSKLQGSWQTPRMPERQLGVTGRAPRAQLWASAVSAPSLMTRAGAYIYVVMEQLVFMRPGGEMCGLDEVDAVIYSELWRDVELFVSVAGVRAAQADEVLRGALASRGLDEVPELRLSGAARVRGEVLSAIFERVHWGSACEVGKELVWVHDPDGERRSVELATGLVRDASGSLLDSAVWLGDGRHDSSLEQEVSLPFEGDGLLWTILRKAHHMATDGRSARMVAG